MFDHLKKLNNKELLARMRKTSDEDEYNAICDILWDRQKQTKGK